MPSQRCKIKGVITLHANAKCLFRLVEVGARGVLGGQVLRYGKAVWERPCVPMAGGCVGVWGVWGVVARPPYSK